MNKKVGLWIDHKKAVIVFLDGAKETIKEIASNIEKHTESNMTPEDQKERKVRNHLQKYYQEVIACIHEAESIFIFGPSEAKHEIKKQIKNQEMKKHVDEIETSDKMTNPQIAAKIRAHFATKAPAPEKKEPSAKKETAPEKKKK
ncbi:MAG: hypothetical protein AABZ60_01415 [Planctomycetota bacterium]